MGRCSRAGLELTVLGPRSRPERPPPGWLARLIPCRRCYPGMGILLPGRTSRKNNFLESLGGTWAGARSEFASLSWRAEGTFSAVGHEAWVVATFCPPVATTLAQ